MEEHPDEAVRVNVLGTRIVADPSSFTYSWQQGLLLGPGRFGFSTDMR
jgi:hypothetical protein